MVRTAACERGDPLAPSPIPPPRWAGRLLGPFTNEARVFEVAELDALRPAVDGIERSFEPSLVAAVCGLLNEMAMSWLAGPVLEVLLESEEAGGDEEAEGAAAQLFPKHAIQTLRSFLG